MRTLCLLKPGVGGGAFEAAIALAAHPMLLTEADQVRNALPGAITATALSRGHEGDPQ